MGGESLRRNRLIKAYFEVDDDDDDDDDDDGECETSDSYCGDYEDYCLLQCDAV
jgi:hypothetical protein